MEKYFPPEAKARVQDMVKNLLAAMKDDIETRPWMSDETKQKALGKLATFNPKIGYPDKWKDYSKLDIRRDDYFNDVMVASRFAVEDDLQLIGKPVDRGRWDLTTPTSDAYYNPLLNEIVFPAGILQPPAFYLDAVDAVNYGAIGVVIGHEISHGFDDQGAQYAADGSLTNWWTADDIKKFQERGACVADQFEHYYIEKDIHHNGKLVLGESIGDLGGAKIAYLAFQKAMQGKPRPAGSGRIHAGATVLHRMGPVSRRRHAARGPAVAGAKQRTSGFEIPRKRTVVEPAGISAGLPMQSRRCHGAASGEAV